MLVSLKLPAVVSSRKQEQVCLTELTMLEPPGLVRSVVVGPHLDLGAARRVAVVEVDNKVGSRDGDPEVSQTGSISVSALVNGRFRESTDDLGFPLLSLVTFQLKGESDPMMRRPSRQDWPCPGLSTARYLLNEKFLNCQWPPSLVAHHYSVDQKLVSDGKCGRDRVLLTCCQPSAL